MPVEPETPNHQPLEMPQQEIREIERAGLGLGERREHRPRGEELIAMRARNALDALFTQHRIEQSAGAAIAVGDENRTVVRARGLNERTRPRPEFFRADCAVRPADSARPRASQPLARRSAVISCASAPQAMISIPWPLGWSTAVRHGSSTQ